MTGQAESSGMRDSLSINKEHVGLLSDLFRDLYEQGAFSEPEKTRNILVRHTIHDRHSLSNLIVHLVQHESSEKNSVTLIYYIYYTQVSILKARILHPFNKFKQYSQ